MSWALSLQNAHTFFFGLRRTGFAISQCSWSGKNLEGGLVVGGGAAPGGRGGAPRVVGRRVGAAAPAARAAAVAAATTTSAETAFRAAAHAVDLRRGVLQRRADLI